MIIWEHAPNMFRTCCSEWCSGPTKSMCFRPTSSLDVQFDHDMAGRGFWGRCEVLLESMPTIHTFGELLQDLAGFLEHFSLTPTLNFY